MVDGYQLLIGKSGLIQKCVLRGHSDLVLCPLTTKIYYVHPWVQLNIWTKSEEISLRLSQELDGRADNLNMMPLATAVNGTKEQILVKMDPKEEEEEVVEATNQTWTMTKPTTHLEGSQGWFDQTVNMVYLWSDSTQVGMFKLETEMQINTASFDYAQPKVLRE